MIKLEDLREIFETAGTGAVDLLLVFFYKDSLYNTIQSIKVRVVAKLQRAQSEKDSLDH